MNKVFFQLACILILFSSCAKPVADFTLGSGTPKAYTPQSFINNSKNATSYVWDFGDGTQSTEMNPTHKYLHSGQYNVKLTVSKGNKNKTMTKQVIIDPLAHCMILIETEFGNMLVELYDATPQHRDNFIKLVEQGFYNGLSFHRVINGFMIQGGDPNSREAGIGQPLGSGGPGYTIPAEFSDTLFHLKGALAAARMGDMQNPEKRSSGSQFYIVQGRPTDPAFLKQKEASGGFHYPTSVVEQYQTIGGTPHLDREYTVFGRVIEGLDVIDRIAAQPTASGDRPKTDIRMKMVVIK